MEARGLSNLARGVGDGPGEFAPHGRPIHVLFERLGVAEQQKSPEVFACSIYNKRGEKRFPGFFLLCIGMIIMLFQDDIVVPLGERSGQSPWDSDAGS
jgi:hypothetical protein